MAKQGMKRQHTPHPHPKNTQSPVPEIQGKARPIITGTSGASMKVYHQRPISKGHGIVDNDLARDNLENDIPYADLQDL